MHFNEGERHYLVWLRLRRAVFFVSFVLIRNFALSRRRSDFGMTLR
jgi:hypothetical protein